MYLRAAKVSKDGKAAYWRLVRSVRIGRKVRQETVAYLGKLDARGRRRAQALAEHLGARKEQPGLFDPPLDKDIAEIRLKEVRMERMRRFGDVWLAVKLWQMAGFEDFFQDRLPQGEEDIPWRTVAQILAVARLCEPSSELHIAEDWLRKTALADILGIREERITDDRLYRSLDKILPLKSALEVHLKKQWEGLFGISYDLMLYDVTSTYFEGMCKINPQAQRGYSRDHRRDCKQVTIGLVVTREGYPLGYEVFAGNLHDSKTVRHMVGSIEARYGQAGRIWVMDRGMISEENLIWLREKGRRYVAGLPKSELKKHAAVISDAQGWRQLPNGVEIRWAQSPGNGQAGGILLCRSPERRAKESAIHERFARRIEEGLRRLERRLETANKSVSLKAAERQVGRLLERNQRAARLFDIEIKPDASRPSLWRLHWQANGPEQSWIKQTEGCYALTTNITDWKDEDIWRTYIQLTQVEEAFRIHKSQLVMRPIWHQKEERVQAHIFVCFLAYVLWKLLEGWQSRSGLGNSPRTILEELGHIASGDVVLPMTAGETIRLRCIVRPENPQKVLLGRLGIDLPGRMRIPDTVSKM